MKTNYEILKNISKEELMNIHEAFLDMDKFEEAIKHFVCTWKKADHSKIDYNLNFEFNFNTSEFITTEINGTKYDKSTILIYSEPVYYQYSDEYNLQILIYYIINKNLKDSLYKWYQSHPGELVNQDIEAFGEYTLHSFIEDIDKKIFDEIKEHENRAMMAKLDINIFKAMEEISSFISI